MSKCDHLLICCGRPLRLNQRAASCRTNRLKLSLFRPLFQPKSASNSNNWHHDIQKEKLQRPPARRKKRRTENNYNYSPSVHRSVPVERYQLNIPHIVFPRYN